MKDDRLYLVHMAECIERIEQYVAEGRVAFLSDIKTQDAVLRNLHVVSESTQRLSEELKAGHPDVDWRAISGLRNVVVHDYLGVKIERIWEIVEVHLSGLKAEVRAILGDFGEPIL